MPGDSHVRQPLDAGAERVGHHGRFLGDGQVARAGGDDEHGPAGAAAGASGAARRTVRASRVPAHPGKPRLQRRRRRLARPGAEKRRRCAASSRSQMATTCSERSSLRKRPPRAAPGGARDGGRCGRTEGPRTGAAAAARAPLPARVCPAATSASRASSCSALTPPRRPARDTRGRSASASAMDSIWNSRWRRSLAPCRPLVYQPRCLRNSTHRLAGVALEPERQPGVLERHAEPLGRGGGRGRGPALEQRAPVAEEPRVPERAAADHDAGAAGVVAHADHVLGRLHVAVADDGNVERLDHARDLVPVGLAREHLGAGARVQREARGRPRPASGARCSPGRAARRSSRSGSSP